MSNTQLTRTKSINSNNATVGVPSALKRNPSITRASLYFDSNKNSTTGNAQQNNKKANQRQGTDGSGNEVFQPTAMKSMNSLKKLMSGVPDQNEDNFFDAFQPNSGDAQGGLQSVNFSVGDVDPADGSQFTRRLSRQQSKAATDNRNSNQGGNSAGPKLKTAISDLFSNQNQLNNKQRSLIPDQQMKTDIQMMKSSSGFTGNSFQNYQPVYDPAFEFDNINPEDPMMPTNDFVNGPNRQLRSMRKNDSVISGKFGGGYKQPVFQKDNSGVSCAPLTAGQFGNLAANFNKNQNGGNPTPNAGAGATNKGTDGQARAGPSSFKKFKPMNTSNTNGAAKNSSSDFNQDLMNRFSLSRNKGNLVQDHLSINQVQNANIFITPSNAFEGGPFFNSSFGQGYPSSSSFGQNASNSNLPNVQIGKLDPSKSMYKESQKSSDRSPWLTHQHSLYNKFKQPSTKGSSGSQAFMNQQQANAGQDLMSKFQSNQHYQGQAQVQGQRRQQPQVQQLMQQTPAGGANANSSAGSGPVPAMQKANSINKAQDNLQQHHNSGSGAQRQTRKANTSSATGAHLQVPANKRMTSTQSKAAEDKRAAAPKSSNKLTKPTTAAKEEASAQSEPGALKKRGRKREKWEVYLENAEKKIDEIKLKLKHAKRDNIPVKERQRLRNMVSAQQSRLKKKNEVLYLHKLINDKDDKNQELLDILKTILQNDAATLQTLTQEIQHKILNDSDEEEEEQPQGGQVKAGGRAANKRQKTSPGRSKMSNKDTLDHFQAVYIDRMITKKEALDKYQQNDEKEDCYYKDDAENEED